MSTTYQNIDEFLDGRGFENFHQWGRALYKHTFGPWVQANCRPLQDDEIERDLDGWPISTPIAGFTVYYDDGSASETWWHPRCTGITVGSIIEGASYDATPFTLTFPFSDELFEENFKALDNEVCQEWEKNNSTYYSIRQKEDNEPILWCQWTAFGDEPEGNFDRDDRDSLDLAKLAAGAIFAAENFREGEKFPIFNHPDLYVQVEETPE